MNKFRLCISFLLVVFVMQLGTTQQKYFKLSKREIKQLSTVELVKGMKKFPESYLYGMHGDNLILLTDISKWNEPTVFAKSKISVEGYDELIISNKADRRQKSLLWGGLLGAVSYAAVKKATETKPYETTISKLITGQQPNNGQIEGVIAGITGFGLGMIIGQTLSKRKMNLKKQKKASMRKLREFTYR